MLLPILSISRSPNPRVCLPRVNSRSSQQILSRHIIRILPPNRCHVSAFPRVESTNYFPPLISPPRQITATCHLIPRVESTMVHYLPPFIFAFRHRTRTQRNDHGHGLAAVRYLLITYLLSPPPPTTDHRHRPSPSAIVSVSVAPMPTRDY